MKKCLIYGNCQTRYLKKLLVKQPEFTDIYDNISEKKVHLISAAEIPDLEQEIAEVDLFIHQPVSDNYRGFSELGTNYLKSKLKPECRVISFPVAYFTGYMPEIIYIKDSDINQEDTCISPYHDFNILEAFYQGKTATETAKLITDPDFYSSQYIKSNLDHTLAELARREKYTDLALSWFIKKYYQKTKLFNTFNHPNQVIFNYLTHNILKLLNLSYIENESLLFDCQEINYNYYPIYPAIAKILDLDFEIDDHYKIENQSFSTLEMIAQFYLFYDRNPQIVESCIKKNRDRYRRCKSQNVSTPANFATTLVREKATINLIDFAQADIPDLTDKLLDLVKQLKADNLSQVAFRICQATVELNPKNLVTWQQLASLYEAEQEFSSAIDCYQKILSISPNCFSIYIKIARLYHLQNQYQKAISYYNLGIEKKPEQPAWVYRFLGSAFKEDAQLDQAIASYQKAMQIEPNYPAIFDIELGNILVEQKLYLEAILHFKKALKQNPQLVEKMSLSIADLKVKVSTTHHDLIPSIQLKLY